MDISYIPATNTDIPIEIISIDNKNNKTITVNLNQSFNGNENFEVFETANPLTEVDITVCNDSVNPDENKKIIVAESRFETDVIYTLKITKDTEVIATPFVVDKYLIKPTNSEVTVFGNRILNVSFETPIEHLDAIDTTNNTLMNFYTLLYDLDSNVSLNTTPEWIGLLTASLDDPNATVPPNQATIRSSCDHKSLEIQMNYRGLPTGDSGFIINYSKTQGANSHYYLHDFSDDMVVVPSMRKEFSVVNDDVTAKAISVKAVDRTNLVVKYDKAVLKKYDEKSVIYVNGSLVTVTEVIRVGNQFDELQYILETPLPIGKIDITVGRITDENGYLTEEVLFPDIPIVAVPPRIIDVDQYGNSQRKIIVIFSKDMKNTDELGGVKNLDYYSISKLDGTFVAPISIIYNIATKTALLELDENLLEGTHTLYADEIQDMYGLSIEPQSIDFGIINTTTPDVVGVTYRDFSSTDDNDSDKTIVVIKYDQSMAYTGEHSIANIENYLIKENLLPISTTTFIMNESKWISLILPGNTSFLPLSSDPADYSILNIGYPKIKEINYVENYVSNIYPLCKTQEIVGPIDPIDISNGVLSVLTPEILEYKYSGDNEFYTIDINDFTITEETTEGSIELVPTSHQLVTTKIIHFIFVENTFDGGSVDITLKTKDQEMLSTDLYGLAILSNKETSPAINELRASIEAVSLVTETDTSAVLRMAFNKEIGHFIDRDFVGTLNDSEVLPLSSSQILSDKKVVEITVSLSRPLEMIDTLCIDLAVTSNYIRTQDISGNKIAAFTKKEVTRFTADSIAWYANTSQTGSIAGSILEIEVNYPIEMTHPGADIQAGGVTFRKEANLSTPDTITLGYDQTMGTIELYKVNNEVLIANTVNTSPVTVELIDNKKVRLTFAATEAAEVHLENRNVNSIDYIPYIDTNNNTLVDKEGIRFLYANYKPTGSVTNV
ncbi:hypothetical protein [Clostridium sp. DL1XJH146]